MQICEYRIIREDIVGEIIKWMITLNFQNPSLDEKKIVLNICLRNILCEMLFDFNLYGNGNWLLLVSIIFVYLLRRYRTAS